MTTEAIFLDRVTKTYLRGWRRKPIDAIRNISLSIAYGESVGFIGHNGAGKSSSIRIALGLQDPTSGVARLQGKDPRDPSSRQRVSYVPENPLLYDYLKPIELLRMAARLHGTPAGRVEHQCNLWLELLGVAGLGSKRIRELSKGMTQRVALAQALVSEPEILILDEPLSGLDPIGRREVVEVLMDFRRSGRTLLFSSHVLNDVEQLADRFAFIHKGSIRTIGSPDVILGAENEAYEVIIESSSCVDGFDRNASGQQRGIVLADSLVHFLSDTVKQGGRVILVRSTNTLENAYLRFVSLANEQDVGGSA